jgi:hypothetical protein
LFYARIDALFFKNILNVYADKKSKGGTLAPCQKTSLVFPLCLVGDCIALTHLCKHSETRVEEAILVNIIQSIGILRKNGAADWS